MYRLWLGHPLLARRFLFNFDLDRARNRRWQGTGIQTVAFTVLFRCVAAVCYIFNLAGTPAANRFFLFSRFTGDSIVTIGMIVAIIPLWPVLLRLLWPTATIVAVIIAGFVLIIVVVAIVGARFLASDPLFFAARDRIGVYPEIMVRKLVIIFGLDAIAVDLRVLRHFLELFEHLRCIATRTAVDPVIAV